MTPTEITGFWLIAGAVWCLALAYLARTMAAIETEEREERRT